MDARVFLDYAVSMKQTIQMTVTRMAHDGSGEGVLDGKPLRVFGMYQGEEGIIEATKKRGIWVGTLKELLRPSPSRKLPDELHHLVCSPWQTSEYPLQAEMKKAVIDELYGYYEDAPKATFSPASQFYGYRTKIEFSFSDRDETGAAAPLALAFHERGGGALRIRLPEGCLLASAGMNKAALMITERLRGIGLSARDLKTLVIRESKSTGKKLALVYAKAEAVERFSVEDIPDLSGLIVFHSTEKSPASVPTKELWRWGEGFLDEMILGQNIRYSWDSFFQNNVPMFEVALRDMRSHIGSAKNILELYSGVGAIGIPLTDIAEKVHGVEIVPAAADFAKANAKHGGITNYVAECIPAEKIDERLFDDKDVLVLDPPRSGLHPTVIATILKKLPTKVVYLSCNPETQARDYSLLSGAYRITSVGGYDLYPQTPHLESLLVLERRN